MFPGRPTVPLLVRRTSCYPVQPESIGGREGVCGSLGSSVSPSLRSGVQAGEEVGLPPPPDVLSSSLPRLSVCVSWVTVLGNLSPTDGVHFLTITHSSR